MGNMSTATRFTAQDTMESLKASVSEEVRQQLMPAALVLTRRSRRPAEPDHVIRFHQPAGQQHPAECTAGGGTTLAGPEHLRMLMTRPGVSQT